MEGVEDKQIFLIGKMIESKKWDLKGDEKGQKDEYICFLSPPTPIFILNKGA